MPETTTLDIPVPGTGEGVTKIMAAEVDGTIAQVLNQQFATQAAEFNAQANRARAGDAAVAELVRNVAVQTTQLVGAKAAQNLEVDRLGQQILAERSVRDQPGSSPFSNPSVAK